MSKDVISTRELLQSPKLNGYRHFITTGKQPPTIDKWTLEETLDHIDFKKLYKQKPWFYTLQQKQDFEQKLSNILKEYEQLEKNGKKY